LKQKVLLGVLAIIVLGPALWAQTADSHEIAPGPVASSPSAPGPEYMVLTVTGLDRVPPFEANKEARGHLVVRVTTLDERGHALDSADNKVAFDFSHKNHYDVAAVFEVAVPKSAVKLRIEIAEVNSGFEGRAGASEERLIGAIKKELERDKREISTLHRPLDPGDGVALNLSYEIELL